jgi:DNA invertase Pin-like site-specific DNA recombinase
LDGYYFGEGKGVDVIYALIRQLSDKESLLAQRASIVQYAEKKQLVLESEMIEFEQANRSLRDRQPFQDFLRSLGKGDEVIIDRIEVLGQSVEEAIVVIHCFLSREIMLHIASRNLLVGGETRLRELLPMLLRLQEEPISPGGDHRVGRPKGRRSASKFDIHLSEIVAGIKAGKSVSAIARELKISRSSLKDYIESRGLRQILDDSRLEKAKNRLNKKVAPEPEMACTLNQDISHSTS